MIIGAGLAGMVAACVFPREELWEARPRTYVEHQALLRFRSPAISELTGIPFRHVTVHKGIWLDDDWAAPSIRACNMYALKVVGRLADRSVWDVAPCERWVPPADFHARMCDVLGQRVHWESAVPIDSLAHADGPIISTIPLPVLAASLLNYHGEFMHAEITVTKAIVEGSDVFQTVYFPSPVHGLYRASLMGSQLTCEWTGTGAADLGDVESACLEVSRAFGDDAVGEAAYQSLSELHVQAYGKLLPIAEDLRKSLIVRLTNDYGIYSLGRYATWRNILLDDVLHDAAVIKRLIAATAYDRQLIAHKEI